MRNVIPFRKKRGPLKLTDKEKEQLQTLKTAKEYEVEKQREASERKRVNERTIKEYRLK